MLRLTRAFSLILVVVLFVDCKQENAQYMALSNLYYFSMQSSDKTDQFIEDNQELFNAQFFSHLEQLRKRVGHEGANWDKYCNLVSDERAAECRSDNWSLHVYLWTLSIEEAIKKQTPWKQTLIGQGTAYSEQLCELYKQMGMPGLCKLVSRIGPGVTRAIAQSLVFP